MAYRKIRGYPFIYTNINTNVAFHGLNGKWPKTLPPGDAKGEDRLSFSSLMCAPDT
jgi:hypothetical protein